MKKPLCILLLAFAAVITSGASAVKAEFSSYVGDKRYTFVITLERQAKCPTWNPKTQPNPPLAASRALVTARKWVAAIQQPEDYTWEFEDLSLIDACGWTWRGRFRLAYKGVADGPPRIMDCYILMDGSVIKPTITTVLQRS